VVRALLWSDCGQEQKERGVCAVNHSGTYTWQQALHTSRHRTDYIALQRMMQEAVCAHTANPRSWQLSAE
jgi:hypothetical protein